MTGGSLAWRLGLLLGGVVLVVLLVADLVVNRVVSRGFESVVTTQQQARLDTAADALAATLSPPFRETRGGVAVLRNRLQRLAVSLGGQVSMSGISGDVALSVGRIPAGSTSTLHSSIVSDAGQVGTLTAVVPASADAGSGFLDLFNLTLAGAGLLSVVGIVLLASYGANRLIRPLRSVVDAAHRLGSGDLRARARGGPDRESAELAGAFNLMAERLERSEMLRRRASSDVAHDLATPATVLESQLQAMVDGVVPADREQLEAARSAAGALGSVIGQMGELASAEAAPLQRRVQDIDLGAMVADVGRALDGLFRERSASLIVTGSALSTGDPDQLARALRNVISNAAQHSPPGRPVEVMLAEEAGEALLWITDYGPGIAPEDLPHVFERFYRADRSRASADDAGRPGSGIGLTIARELLAANGGSISVEHTGPEGTTFLIELLRSGTPRLT
jgi:signal transduction histidine kinase